MVINILLSGVAYRLLQEGFTCRVEGNESRTDIQTLMISQRGSDHGFMREGAIAVFGDMFTCSGINQSTTPLLSVSIYDPESLDQVVHWATNDLEWLRPPVQHEFWGERVPVSEYRPELSDLRKQLVRYITIRRQEKLKERGQEPIGLAELDAIAREVMDELLPRHVRTSN